MNALDFLQNMYASMIPSPTFLSYASPHMLVWMTQPTTLPVKLSSYVFLVIATTILIFFSYKYKKKWVPWISYLLPILVKFTVIKEPLNSPGGFIGLIFFFALVGMTHVMTVLVSLSFKYKKKWIPWTFYFFPVLIFLIAMMSMTYSQASKVFLVFFIPIILIHGLSYALLSMIYSAPDKNEINTSSNK